jgi:hypothetical protein
MQREGIFREMKLRGHYEKPSEKKARARRPKPSGAPASWPASARSAKASFPASRSPCCVRAVPAGRAARAPGARAPHAPLRA